MNLLKKILAPLTVVLAINTTTHGEGKSHKYDIVIYGGTSAGVTAAVQASRMDRSVAIVGPDKHLGGLSSGGLGFTDTGRKEVIGGLSREFYERIYDYYRKPDYWKYETEGDFLKKKLGMRQTTKDAMWSFEPSVAESVFEDLIRENKIPVFRDQWLDRENGVVKSDGRIKSITMLSGMSFEAKVFIDASYEGDLLAAAGVSYHVGREANSVYGETWNGVQAGVFHHDHHFGDMKISPYKVPGDPDSGVLARISTVPAEPNGSGDKMVQAYCFRMCLTNEAENRIPFPKPEGYDPDQYELLLRIFEHLDPMHVFHKFDPVPNNKTDSNNHGPFSFDNIGMNWDYPEASYERRREIIEEHKTYQLGMLYFLSNDPRVPEKLREAMKVWGLPKDEFVDNGNWSHQLYVREARRMVGKHVITEHDLIGNPENPKSIGMGSYGIDSHNTQRYITPEGYVQNEGDVGVKVPPYQITYDAIVPKENECSNLLVPVAASCSHVAYGSVRMEPVFMILGQSAGTAASLAIEDAVSVQNVDYPKLKARLTADKQVLEFKR
ncbi:FAD-dependent oxidoreductase [Haloferula chungangensis]|uniref:FAD-dependent oxidoreductase n=1 Tax=Haloferula chungangensis TaxID=1048331 RepID=A0ABW2L7W7_9BACT